MLDSAVFFFTYGLSIILNGTGVLLQVSLPNGPSGASGEAVLSAGTREVIAVHQPDDSFAVFRKTTYNRVFRQDGERSLLKSGHESGTLSAFPTINIALAHNVLNYSNIAGLNILMHLELF